jgi:hypothetical protein
MPPACLPPRWRCIVGAWAFFVRGIRVHRVIVPAEGALRRDAVAFFVWATEVDDDDHDRNRQGSKWESTARLLGIATVDTFPLVKAGWGEIDGWYFVQPAGCWQGCSVTDAMDRPLRLALSDDIERNEATSIGQLHVHVVPTEGHDSFTASTSTFDEWPLHGQRDFCSTDNDRASKSNGELFTVDASHRAWGNGDDGDCYNESVLGLDDSSVTATPASSSLSLSEQLSQNLLELDSLMERTLHLHNDDDDDDDDSDGDSSSDNGAAAGLGTSSASPATPISTAARRPTGIADADGGDARHADTGAEEELQRGTQIVGGEVSAVDRERLGWERSFQRLCFEDLEDAEAADGQGESLGVGALDIDGEGVAAGHAPTSGSTRMSDDVGNESGDDAEAATPLRAREGGRGGGKHATQSPLVDSETLRIAKILSPGLEKDL